MVSEPYGSRTIAVMEAPLLNYKPKARKSKTLMKYSCEEIYDRMSNGLCIFCEDLDTPGHHDLKHKGVKIFVTEGNDESIMTESDEKPIAEERLVKSDGFVTETIKQPESFSESLEGSTPDLQIVVAAGQKEAQNKSDSEENMSLSLGNKIEHIVGKPSREADRVWEPGGLISRPALWVCLDKYRNHCEVLMLTSKPQGTCLRNNLESFIQSAKGTQRWMAYEKMSYKLLTGEVPEGGYVSWRVWEQGEFSKIKTLGCSRRLVMLLRSEFKTAHKSEQLQISSELLDEDKALRFAERGVEIFEMQTDGYGRVSGPEQKIIVHGFETTKLAISHRFESPFPMQPMTWREMGNAPPDHAESIFKSVEPKTSLTVSHVYHRWKNKVRKWQADYVLLIWCLASSGSSNEHGLNEDVLSCYTTGQAKDEEISLYVKAKGSIEISQILLRNKKKKRRSKYWRFKFNDKSMEHKLTTGLIVLIKQMIVTLSSVTCLGLNGDTKMLPDGIVDDGRVFVEKHASLDAYNNACLLLELIYMKFIGGKTHGKELLVAGQKVVPNQDLFVELHRMIHLEDELSLKKRKCDLVDDPFGNIFHDSLVQTVATSTQLKNTLTEFCRFRKADHCITHETDQTASHLWHRWRSKSENVQAVMVLKMLGLVIHVIVLNQWKSFGVLLIAVAMSLTLWSDRHILVAEKNMTEISIATLVKDCSSVCRFLLGAYLMNLFAEQDQDCGFSACLTEWKENPPDKESASFSSLRTRMF